MSRDLVMREILRGFGISTYMMEQLILRIIKMGTRY